MPEMCPRWGSRTTQRRPGVTRQLCRRLRRTCSSPQWPPLRVVPTSGEEFLHTTAGERERFMWMKTVRQEVVERQRTNTYTHTGHRQDVRPLPYYKPWRSCFIPALRSPLSLHFMQCQANAPQRPLPWPLISCCCRCCCCCCRRATATTHLPPGRHAHPPRKVLEAEGVVLAPVQWERWQLSGWARPRGAGRARARVGQCAAGMCRAPRQHPSGPWGRTHTAQVTTTERTCTCTAPASCPPPRGRPGGHLFGNDFVCSHLCILYRFSNHLCNPTPPSPHHRGPPLNPCNKPLGPCGPPLRPTIAACTPRHVSGAKPWANRT